MLTIQIKNGYNEVVATIGNIFSLEVNDEVNKGGKMKLRFPAEKRLRKQPLQKGYRVSVYYGLKIGNVINLFEGYITDITLKTTEVVLEAENRLSYLQNRMVRSKKTYSNAQIKDVISGVFTELNNTSELPIVLGLNDDTTTITKDFDVGTSFYDILKYCRTSNPKLVCRIVNSGNYHFLECSENAGKVLDGVWEYDAKDTRGTNIVDWSWKDSMDKFYAYIQNESGNITNEDFYERTRLLFEKYDKDGTLALPNGIAIPSIAISRDTDWWDFTPGDRKNISIITGYDWLPLRYLGLIQSRKVTINAKGGIKTEIKVSDEYKSDTNILDLILQNLRGRKNGGDGEMPDMSDYYTKEGTNQAISVAVSGKSDINHTHLVQDITNFANAVNGLISTALEDYITENDLNTALSGYSQTGHTHNISDVEGLETALSGKANSTHSHTVSDITDFSTAIATAISGKADVNHTHSITDVNGLEQALDGKASSVHTHSISDITNLQTTLNAKAEKSQIKLFVIKEDMVTVTKTATKGVAPYNTSYYYTDITINANAGIERIEGAHYQFIINSTLVVASSYRNVRVRIGTGDYIPMKNRANTILAGNSYMAKGRNDFYTYKTTYETGGALHLQAGSDTTYSAMSVAEGTTGTATSARSMRADYLKQIIEYYLQNIPTPTEDTHSANKKYVDDINSAIQTSLGNKANSSDVYTKSQTYSKTEVDGLIPTVNDSTITIQVNGTTLKSITLNQSSGETINIPVPTQTSELTNNSGFITNAVNDLTNYYKKSETYTKSEVNTLISNFGGFEVVSVLPTTDIKTNVIYLKGPIGSGTDKYEEYIYYNNTWTLIGETSVDLSNYIDKNTNFITINGVAYKFGDVVNTPNTEYDTMTQQEATTGTGTTARVITPKVLADTIANAISGKANSSDIKDGLLTIKQNNVSKGTFSANQSGPTTVELTDTTYGKATANDDGLMSKEDFSKLSGIEAQAQKNTITGVKGNAENSYRTGNVNITKGNIGLGNVDNTSDADKPISTAVQNALNNKANSTHSHSMSDITNLDTEFAKYLPLTGGTLTGNLTGQYGTFTLLRTTSATQLSSSPTKIAVLDSNGWVYYRTLTNLKSDMSLNNVDNTSDANKPISNATQQALNQKADSSSIGQGVLTLTYDGDTLGTFGANQSANKTIAIPVGSSISELTENFVRTMIQAGIGDYDNVFRASSGLYRILNALDEKDNLGLTEGEVWEDIVSDSTSMSMISHSYSAMVAVASSEVAMTELLSNNNATKEVSECWNSICVIAESSLASDLYLSSANGITNLFTYQTAQDAFFTDPNKKTEIVNEYIMTIVNNNTLLSNLYTDTVVATAIENSQEALTTIAGNSTKLSIVNSSSQIMTAIAGNSSALGNMTDANLTTYFLESSSYLTTITSTTAGQNRINSMDADDLLPAIFYWTGLSGYASFQALAEDATAIAIVENSEESMMIIECNEEANEYFGNVPSDYIELEYLRGTGSQYINTGVKLNTTARMDSMEIYVKATHTGSGNFIGMYNNNYVTLEVVGNNTNTLRRFNGNGSTYSDTNCLHNDNSTIDEITYSFSSTTATWIVNGTTYTSSRSTGYNNGDKTLTLFARNSSNIEQYLNMKLYHCYIKVGGVLERDFYPCMRKSDSVLGLWDKVNKVFYTNNGSGTFTAGTPIVSRGKVQFVEYIQSSGTQWINTNYIPKSTSGFEVKFQNISNINTYRTILGARYSTSANAFWIGYMNSKSYYELSPANVEITDSSLYRANTGVDYTLKFENKTLTNNGNTVGSNINFTQDADRNLFLFAGNSNGGTNPFEACASKMYYCKLYEGGNLVRDYKPCYVKGTSFIGLRDEVEKKFYGNAGTGAFTKGSDV